MSLRKEDLLKLQIRIAKGEIDLRDIGEKLFGKWDQDFPSKMIELAILGCENKDTYDDTLKR